MRSKVLAGANPWKATYDAIPSYLNYAPKAQAVFSGVTTSASCNPMNAFFEDGNAAYASALRWVVNRNQAEANKAIQILNAWANANTTFQGDGQVTLCVSWYSPRFAFAAEIMKHYGASGWSSSAQEIFKNWVNAKIIPKLQSINVSSGGTARNNWAALGAGARAAWGVYLENTSLYNSGVAGYRDLVTFQISKFGHNVLDGFHYETCRASNSNGGLEGGDLPHTSMSFMGLTLAAEVGKHQGLDLYGYRGSDDGFSLRTAVLAHGQWWWNPDRSGSTKAGWPCDMAFPGQTFGDTAFQPQSWQTLYNHYRDSLLLSLSNYQGTTGATKRNIAIPWDRLTHNYTGQVPTQPPSVAISAPANVRLVSGQ